MRRFLRDRYFFSKLNQASGTDQLRISLDQRVEWRALTAGTLTYSITARADHVRLTHGAPLRRRELQAALLVLEIVPMIVKTAPSKV